MSDSALSGSELSDSALEHELANLPDPYAVRLAPPGSARQADEHFQARLDGIDRWVNIHDYDTLYQYPFLYDIVLYRYLRCRTPFEIARALADVWRRAGVEAANVRMLDIGAGSGAFALVLRRLLGVRRISGLDLCPNAREAARRDRPGLYDSYFVDDLTDLAPETEQALRAANYDCVGVASATGWGNHIPVAGFEAAFSLLSPAGWFIFHVKPNDPDPECQALCTWVDRKLACGALDPHHRASHYHRRSSLDTDIYYDVIIGRKA